MYTIVKLKDKIRVPPVLFKEKLSDAIEQVIKNEYEGMLTKEAGVLLMLNSISEIGEGMIIPEDGAVYYETVFDMLAWEPQMHEVVEGRVSEIREFGVFVRIGPIDGLVHVSQAMDDFVNYTGGALVGKQTGIKIKVGSEVRGRVIAISMKSKESAKIGLTLRQPGLGKIELIKKEFEEAKKKKSSGEKKVKSKGSKK